MKLIRNIIVEYGGKLNEVESFDCNMRVDGKLCGIKSLCIWDEDPPIQVLLSGEIQLNDSPRVDENFIQIPEEPRKHLETRLEYLANMVSIVNSAKRKLFSPVPTVAFVPESEDDEAYLTDHSFPDQLSQKSQMITNPNLEMDNELINKLRDRMGGVMLMSEALSCRHATGAFHEYVRLFERAFREANKDLIDPLQAFLDEGKYSIGSNEADKWISDFRHPSIHADERDYFHIESDLRPIIGRVKQAAFDVLLNKENWRSNDQERRDLWNLKGFIKNPKGNSLTIEYEANTKKTVSFDPPTTFDFLQAYPIHDMGMITDPPDKWWY